MISGVSMETRPRALAAETRRKIEIKKPEQQSFQPVRPAVPAPQKLDRFFKLLLAAAFICSFAALYFVIQLF